MTDPKTHIHYVSTSGSGSSFEVYVYQHLFGDHRLNGVCVASQIGFRSRSAAATWGRRKIKELEA